VTRYLRLYLAFLRFSFGRAMEFRLDFFFRVFMDGVWYAVNLAFFLVIYRHTSLLGGWTEDQVLVFAAGVFVADAVHMTVFSNNLWWFPILVNKGDLDYYLVRPVSTLYFVSLRDFAANSFLNLLVAGGILAWALLRYPEPLPADRVAVYLALLAAGCLLNYALHMVFLIPVFWLHSSAGLRDLFFAFERFTARPHRIFHGWVRRLLTSLLPFSILVSFPTAALFEGPSGELLLHTLAVLVAFFLFLNWFWRRGLKAYSSASS
jgi:ABC-2 type transport system permease protein